jgi:hypothetical protein
MPMYVNIKRDWADYDNKILKENSEAAWETIYINCGQVRTGNGNAVV